MSTVNVLMSYDDNTIRHVNNSAKEYIFLTYFPQVHFNCKRWRTSPLSLEWRESPVAPHRKALLQQGYLICKPSTTRISDMNKLYAIVS